MINLLDYLDHKAYSRQIEKAQNEILFRFTEEQEIEFHLYFADRFVMLIEEIAYRRFLR